MTSQMKSKFVTDFQHRANHIRNPRTKENRYAKNSLNKRQRIQTMQNKQTIITISDNETDRERMEQIEFAREIMFIFVLELIRREPYLILTGNYG